jgi:hypothetical protein
VIHTDEEMTQAQQGVVNLQTVLLAARKVHPPEEYRLMSEPILLELQQREQEILEYLAQARDQSPAA